MGDILSFKKKVAAEKEKGEMLCRNGFHDWKVQTEQQFDVKQGKLVTVYVCVRCGKKKFEIR